MKRERKDGEKVRRKLPAKALSTALVLGCLTGFLSLVAGCGSGSVKLTSKQARAFDNAPATVKQVWDKALKAEQSQDYLTAQNALESLQKMDLTSQQKQALSAEFFAFHQRLYQAAEKGDPAAVKAMKEINAHYKR